MPDAGHPTEMMMDEIPDTQNAPAEQPVDPVDRVLERARGRSDVWVFGSGCDGKRLHLEAERRGRVAAHVGAWWRLAHWWLCF